VTATKTGLEWDLTGNVCVVDRRSWQAHPGHLTDSYVLHITSLDGEEWELIETSTARRLHKDHAETRTVLSRNLRDVGTDGSPRSASRSGTCHQHRELWRGGSPGGQVRCDSVGHNPPR